MKVLSIDPGATRLGFGIIEREGEDKTKSKLRYHGSGYYGLSRGTNKSKKEPYQEYRLRLIVFWVEEVKALLNSHKPDVVVSEIVPVVGGGNFVVATQSQLASTAITTIQAIAVNEGYEIKQIGATTVKARIGGGKKATKVAVRNGVMKLMPQLADRKAQWTKVFEEPDALAVGLTHLGCKI